VAIAITRDFERRNIGVIDLDLGQVTVALQVVTQS